MNSIRDTLRMRALPIGLCLIAAMGGAVAARAGARALSTRTRPSENLTPILKDSTPVTNIGEFAIFLGDVECAACKTPGLPHRVQTLLDSLRKEAAIRKHTFSSIGIVLNGPLKPALNWLDQFGPFDEVSLGDQWLNMGVVKYVWNYPSGLPSIPQVLLFEHSVTTAQHSIDVGSDSLIYRWLGVRGIAPDIVRAMQPPLDSGVLQPHK
jgi:hypothetical protein